MPLAGVGLARLEEGGRGGWREMGEEAGGRWERRLEEDGKGGWRRGRRNSYGSGKVRSIRGERCWRPKGYPLQLEI